MDFMCESAEFNGSICAVQCGRCKPKARLKPCPFCSATDSEDNACQTAGVITKSFQSPIGKRAFRVECCCGSQGPARLDCLEAEAAWNKRSIPQC